LGPRFPKFLERLLRDGREITRAGPGEKRIKASALYNRLQFLRQPADTFHCAIQPGVVHDRRVNAKGGFLEKRGSLPTGVSAILEEVMVQIDFDRAGLSAGAAEGAGGGKMFPLLQTAQVGCDH
jgi:hypothetical protein